MRIRQPVLVIFSIFNLFSAVRTAWKHDGGFALAHFIICLLWIVLSSIEKTAKKEEGATSK
jgi:hypothetical protein